MGALVEKPFFASREEYVPRFTDAAYWQPYIEAVCARHRLPCQAIRAGLPGTNPVFVVTGGAGCVVKFFETHLFNGLESWNKERALYGLLAEHPELPAPMLLAEGAFFDDGAWPYLVTTVIPGTSLGEVADQVTYEDRVTLAGFLGRLLRQLHDLPFHDILVLCRSGDEFSHFLAEQRDRCVTRHQQWKVLPAHLLAQIDGYLLPDEQLIDQRVGLRLTHCDLNQDHVLGDFVVGHWRPNGIIDFGDARVGDRIYDLIALHMGLFYGDKHLLATFLDAYGLDDGLRTDFVQRAMNYTLLFEFNVLEMVQSWGLDQVQTLDELANRLWAAYTLSA
jgi:Ser/Thr protein kinase RdoA (MazF antagonist)